MMDKMQFKDEQAEKEWREWVGINSTDPYSLSVCYFVVLWANQMERHIRVGEAVAEIAEIAAKEPAREVGLTGFQYGLAVSALAQWWKYGEELRRWHNLDTQIGNEGEQANAEGGVLNPAILNVGTKE